MRSNASESVSSREERDRCRYLTAKSRAIGLPRKRQRRCCLLLGNNNNNSNNSNSHSNNDVATTNPSARQNERLCGNLEQGAQMFLTMVQVQRDQLRDSHVARAVQNATPGSWDDARRTASEVVCNAGTWISEGRDRLFETAPERWLQVRTGASEAVAMAGDWVEQASSAVSSSIRRTDVSGEDRPLATWFRERFGTSNDEGQEVVLEAVEPTEPYQVGGSSGSNAYPADGGGEWVGEEWADEETWNQEAPAGPSLGHSFEELSRGPTSPRRPLNPDEEIKRYLFSDENTVVKVYIQASDLDISKIASADVTLSPTTLSIRIQSADNATLVLSKQRLSHAIDVDKSRHNLPKTGHKLSITLCKADPRQVWTQLFSKQGQTETLTPMTFI
mmetsp:Transcript_2995/g.7275  ORF Transcript_2995/g.7275 Transcript_2995/m.7275 type:complete len:389 (+) Transcript_2995:133-1299(+)